MAPIMQGWVKPEMNQGGGRGPMTEPIWFWGCGATTPLCDTGGHDTVGANRRGEGQLACSFHTHASASQSPLHLR